MAAQTVAARHLSSCCDFCLPADHAFARALSCCDTRLGTSHQTWPTNRPDLSSVVYRLLAVIQECVYQKQQGTSNIVDELWLLTEWQFIKRMAYYISQGRVEISIRIDGQFCGSFVANLLQYRYLCATNYQNTVRFDKIIAKIKRCNFFCPTVFFAPQCICNLGQWTLLWILEQLDPEPLATQCWNCRETAVTVFTATRIHSADDAVARSVCPSVTRRYSVETAKHILKLISP